MPASSKSSNQSAITLDEIRANFNAYKRKHRLMNKSELIFFNILSKTLVNEFIICPKVRIEDFITVPNGLFPDGQKLSYRGRIKSRHIDFLLCRKIDSLPVLAIEIDGASHGEIERRERDGFVNRLYRLTGLPILHIHVGENFNLWAKHINKILTNNLLT